MKASEIIGVLALVVAVACTGTARGLEAYRTDTQALLETRDAQLQQCYDDALKTDDKLAGTVTVDFVIEKKTGAIENPIVNVTKSTASAPLGDCVIKAIQGLVLAPGDRHEGHATFVYEFKHAPANANSPT
jgi:hypothetical protein